MAVDPDHQRQGVGSTLLKMLCDVVDANALDIFVLSSPDGIQLYSKFGFKAVGVVETKQGSFTSMLRNQFYLVSKKRKGKAKCCQTLSGTYAS
jgi:predicted N-acetyltransferase YhbS